jgi:hypothetical protein
VEEEESSEQVVEGEPYEEVSTVESDEEVIGVEPDHETGEAEPSESVFWAEPWDRLARAESCELAIEKAPRVEFVICIVEAVLNDTFSAMYKKLSWRRLTSLKATSAAAMFHPLERKERLAPPGRPAVPRAVAIVRTFKRG